MMMDRKTWNCHPRIMSVIAGNIDWARNICIGDWGPWVKLWVKWIAIDNSHNY